MACAPHACVCVLGARLEQLDLYQDEPHQVALHDVPHSTTLDLALIRPRHVRESRRALRCARGRGSRCIRDEFRRGSVATRGGIVASSSSAALCDEVCEHVVEAHACIVEGGGV
jgi:hypothetical protein